MRPILKTKVPGAVTIIALVLALCGCMWGYGAGSSEFEEDPRASVPEDNPTVEVEVLRVGLDGHVTTDGPSVLVYRIRNRGQARQMTLELTEWPPPEYMPWGLTLSANVAPLNIKLGQNEEQLGEWVLPWLGMHVPYSGDKQSAILLLVRGSEGEILGATALPEIKQSSQPVAVISANADIGLKIQDAVHRADIGAAAHYGRREVALIVNRLPNLWHEYDAMGAVIMARPWADLSEATRRALERWVAFGGNLIFIPSNCPDWRGARPARTAVPGVEPQRYGVGRVYVEPTFAGGVYDRGAWLSQVLPLRDGGEPGWNAVQPPLELAYVMPSATLLIAIILAIVAIIGPVTHLVLLRLRRREWAWIVLPMLSLVFAGGMYAVASGVKGEESALEIHYLVQSFGDADEAAVTTAVRIQSARAGLRTVRVKGTQPRPSLHNSYRPFSGGADQRMFHAHAAGAEVDRISMHRFSSHDITFTFAGQSQPIRIELSGEEGVRITNKMTGELTDIYLARPSGWTRLADRLGQGEMLERRSLGPGVSIHELADEPFESPKATFLTGLLHSATVRHSNRGMVEDLLLVAGCEAPDLPIVTLTPEPIKTKVRATCTWQLPYDTRAREGRSP